MNSIQEGTFILAPWFETAPPSEEKQYSHSRDDGLVNVTITRERRIIAEIISESYHQKFRIVSGRIRVLIPQFFMIFIVWKLPEHFCIYLELTQVADLKTKIFEMSDFSFPEQADAENSFPESINVETMQAMDFASRNHRAFLKRRQLYESVSSHAQFSGISYLLESLSEELSQLNSLCKLIDQGDVSHRRGLAARLRLLLYRAGEQKPLLALLAGAANADMTIYTSRNPKFIPPITAAIHYPLMFSAYEHEVFSNPVDIDVWLSLPAMRLQGHVLSNSDLIKTLGDKIGAHLDPNLSPAVVALRSLITTSERTVKDGSAVYLTKVAEMVQVLGYRVIMSLQNS